MLITQDDIIAKYSEKQLLALAPDGVGGLNQDIINHAMMNAEAEVIASLGRQYQIPIPDGVVIPNLIKAIMVDLTWEQLYRDKLSDGLRDIMRTRRQNLSDIAGGLLWLNLPIRQSATGHENLIGGYGDVVKEVYYG